MQTYAPQSSQVLVPCFGRAQPSAERELRERPHVGRRTSRRPSRATGSPVRSTCPRSATRASSGAYAAGRNGLWLKCLGYEVRRSTFHRPVLLRRREVHLGVRWLLPVLRCPRHSIIRTSFCPAWGSVGEPGRLGQGARPLGHISSVALVESSLLAASHPDLRLLASWLASHQFQCVVSRCCMVWALQGVAPLGRFKLSERLCHSSLGPQ